MEGRALVLFGQRGPVAQQLVSAHVEPSVLAGRAMSEFESRLSHCLRQADDACVAEAVRPSLNRLAASLFALVQLSNAHFELVQQTLGRLLPENEPPQKLAAAAIQQLDKFDGLHAAAVQGEQGKSTSERFEAMVARVNETIVDTLKQCLSSITADDVNAGQAEAARCKALLADLEDRLKRATTTMDALEREAEELSRPDSTLAWMQRELDDAIQAVARQEKQIASVSKIADAMQHDCSDDSSKARPSVEVKLSGAASGFVLPDPTANPAALKILDISVDCEDSSRLAVRAVGGTRTGDDCSPETGTDSISLPQVTTAACETTDHEEAATRLFVPVIAPNTASAKNVMHPLPSSAVLETLKKKIQRLREKVSEREASRKSAQSANDAKLKAAQKMTLEATLATADAQSKAMEAEAEAKAMFAKLETETRRRTEISQAIAKALIDLVKPVCSFLSRLQVWKDGTDMARDHFHMAMFKILIAEQAVVGAARSGDQALALLLRDERLGNMLSNSYERSKLNEAQDF